MKFFSYVKALYIMHDNEMTKIEVNQKISFSKRYRTQGKMKRDCCLM